MRILCVIPSLAYSGAAKQLLLLAKGLPRDRFDLRICVFDGAGPLVESFPNHDLTVDVLESHRTFDIAPIFQFRRILKDFDPHVIQTWQMPALRFVCLATLSNRRPIVASAIGITDNSMARLGRLDRAFLERTACVVAATQAEASRLHALGLAAEKIAVVPPGLETAAEDSSANELYGKLGFRPARYLLGVGPLERQKGFLDMLWGMDILRCLYPDLHLIIVGSGSDRERLERFVSSDKTRTGVHFLGNQPAIEPLLKHAEVVCVPSLVERGLNVAVEAMAAGRPVVASRLPALAEIVEDGKTGLLFPPGDKLAFARQIGNLLENEDERTRMGQAGRQRAQDHFSAQSSVASYVGILRVCSGMAPAKVLMRWRFREFFLPLPLPARQNNERVTTFELRRESR